VPEVFVIRPLDVRVHGGEEVRPQGVQDKGTQEEPKRGRGGRQGRKKVGEQELTLDTTGTTKSLGPVLGRRVKRLLTGQMQRTREFAASAMLARISRFELSHIICSCVQYTCIYSG
jgi:hypothetical protein